MDSGYHTGGEVEMSNKGTFTNGSVSLRWINEDSIELKDEYGHVAYIDGGDFESFIRSLISIRETK